ncbi:MAG: thioredoxin [Betaproteobacteria bacterium]
MGHPVTLTDATFAAEVVECRETPVLVDFWASWCLPCRAIAPLVEELAVEYEGRLKVGKLNVDENPQTAAAYGIMSIPTLVLFKDGEPVDRIVGAQPKGTLTKHLDKALKQTGG